MTAEGESQVEAEVVAEMQYDFSRQASKFLKKRRADAGNIIKHLEEKLDKAFSIEAKVLPGWRLQARCRFGNSCYIIDGKGYGALVQLTQKEGSLVYFVHYIGGNAQDIMSNI